MKIVLTYILLLISLTTFGQTQKDMEVINTINMVRTNPKGFIPYVEKYLSNPFTMVTEKVMGKDLINVLNHMEPLDSLTFNSGMYKLSNNWSDYLKSINKIEHGNFGDRFKVYGTAGENLAGGNCLNNPINIVILTLMEKGHRENLLDPKWKYVSVSTNDFVCVQNFSN